MLGLGVVVSIRLDAANTIKYLDLCERRGMTKAQFARWLIDQAIENDRLERLAAELTAARDDTLDELTAQAQELKMGYE